jgi:hypothetical protein
MEDAKAGLRVKQIDDGKRHWEISAMQTIDPANIVAALSQCGTGY